MGTWIDGRPVHTALTTPEAPDLHGLFASINNTDRWVFHLAYDPARGAR